MKPFRFKHHYVVALGLVTFMSGYVVAQTPNVGPALIIANSTSGVPAMKLMPPAGSPIDFFREVLNRHGAERLEFLKDRTPASQKLILDKVHEYELLSPEQRELRLRVTELHYYLLPLMTIPATNRTVLLGLIAPETRKLVEDRLEQWDKLSPESQKDLLQNEAVLGKLTELVGTSPAQQKQLVDSMTDAQKAELEAGIRKWQGLSAEQRNNTVRRFKEFFELTQGEKEHALATLSEAERHQLEGTLASFEKLTPFQRAKCVRSFEKFASLSPQERQQFLKSAEVWNRMTPSQRQLWRDLVYDLSHQPPLPDALTQPPRPRSSPAPSPSAKMTATTN